MSHVSYTSKERDRLSAGSERGRENSRWRSRCRPGSRERHKARAEDAAAWKASANADARTSESSTAFARATPERSTSTPARLEYRKTRRTCLASKVWPYERARQCDSPGDRLEPSDSAASWRRRPRSCPPNSSHQTIFPCRRPFGSKHRTKIVLRRCGLFLAMRKGDRASWFDAFDATRIVRCGFRAV